MTAKTIISAEKIFREHSGMLRASEAKRLGIDQSVLRQMWKRGILTKEARGLYRLSEMEPMSYPDLVQVAVRVPACIICLISALNFHQLTTQIPHRVYIALPQKTKAPRLGYPPLDIVYLSEKPYAAGEEEHILDGHSVRVYCREKTIADCFKFRNKIGLDIALEAMKDYLRQPNRDIEAVLFYARINRVEKIIRPYLQAAL